MGPKEKAPAKGKAGKAKENDITKKACDDAKMEGVLQTWFDAKKKEDEAKKIIESCKTAVEARLAKSGDTLLVTPSFTVNKNEQSRESVSKKDLPADIWSKYA